MKFNKEYSVYYQEGTNQLNTFKNNKGELGAYQCIDFKGKVVLDIGGCAGSFSKLAHDNGAKQIITVEPHPLNLEVLKKNCPYSTIIEAAVVPEDFIGDNISFFEAKTGCLTIGSTSIPKRLSTRNEIKVKAVKFKELLELYKPDVIKIDIEGAEFDIITEALPEYVNQFIAEFHIFMDKERLWKWWHNFCYDYFGPPEWKVIKAPEWPNSDRVMRKFHGMNVLTMAWRRKNK